MTRQRQFTGQSGAIPTPSSPIQLRQHHTPPIQGMIDGSALQSAQRCLEKKSRVVVKMVVSPNGDKNEISLYIINTCSNIQVMRIKRVITKDKKS